MTAPDKYLKKYFGQPNNRGRAAMKNRNIFLIGLTEQNINQTESMATADRSERLQKFHLLISHPRRSPCLFHTNE